MPSTYTTNNGIEKIATGEQSGTWGTTTNVNFDLLDEALDGQISVALTGTGTSGSPNDIEITDGSSSNGRNRFIEFTGSLAGDTYVRLTPNDSEKVFFIHNNTNQTLLLFQGTYDASRDYSLAAGLSAVVRFTGGGTTSYAYNVFTGLDITGTVTADALTVDGSVSLNNNSFVQTALTPSYNMIESDVVGENTQLIQATGTFRIRTVDDAGSSAVERMRIDHGTGDISFYEDTGTTAKFFWDASAESLGIGTSSPTSVNGNSTLLDLSAPSGTAEYVLRGSAAVASWWAGSSAANIGTTTNHEMRFYTNNTQKMVIDENGNVGIGDTVPGARLSLEDTDTTLYNGTANASNNARIVVRNQSPTTGAYAAIMLNAENANSNVGQWTIASVSTATNYDNDLVFHTRTGTSTYAERMRILNNGRIGIGTDAPQEQIHIVANSGNDARILLENQTSPRGNFIGMENSDELVIAADEDNLGGDSNIRFRIDAAEKMRITDTGYVGIGTASPSYNLDIHGSSGDTNFRIYNAGTGSSDDAILRLQIAGTTAGGYIFFGDPDDTNAGEIRYDHTGNYMSFDANGSEKLRILSGGGITFNGDTSVNNALKDYEEGTWSPTMASSTGTAPTFESSTGAYTKIGNVVYFDFQILNIVPGGTSTGYLKVTNLPFTVDVTTVSFACMCDNITFQGGRTMFAGRANTSEFFYFFAIGSGIGDTGVDNSDVASGVTDIFGSGFYYTNQ